MIAGFSGGVESQRVVHLDNSLDILVGTVEGRDTSLIILTSFPEAGEMVGCVGMGLSL